MAEVSPDVQFIATRVCQASGMLRAEELVWEIVTSYDWTEKRARSALFEAEQTLVRTNQDGYLISAAEARRSRRANARV